MIHCDPERLSCCDEQTTSHSEDDADGGEKPYRIAKGKYATRREN